jgi:hypothetical protein
VVWPINGPGEMMKLVMETPVGEMDRMVALIALIFKECVGRGCVSILEQFV